MKAIVILACLIWVPSLVSAQNSVNKSPVQQALSILPEKYSIPEDLIKYVVVERDFPQNSVTWRRATEQKLAFVIPGDDSIYFNIDVVSPDGRRKVDPYHAAINWPILFAQHKKKLDISPAIYIIAAVLVHEHYGHGKGCVESRSVCEDEVRALEIEKEAYRQFQAMSKFKEANVLTGYNPSIYFMQIDALLERYRPKS